MFAPFFRKSHEQYRSTAAKKHGNFVAGAKILVGAMAGKTLDDSIEGKLSPE
jgi:hypothetical protein